MNETLRAIASRYSCRAFSPRLPSDADLQAIAEAAIASPSAVNRQPWRIVVVRDEALIGELETEALSALARMEDRTMYERIVSRGGKLFYGARRLIVIPVDPAVPGGGALLDCGIVCQTIAVAAASLGVDSVICGLAGLAFSGGRAEEFSRRLGFPGGYQFGSSVLLGHAAAPGAPHAPDAGKISFVG